MINPFNVKVTQSILVISRNRIRQMELRIINPRTLWIVPLSIFHRSTIFRPEKFKKKVHEKYEIHGLMIRWIEKVMKKFVSKHFFFFSFQLSSASLKFEKIKFDSWLWLFIENRRELSAIIKKNWWKFKIGNICSIIYLIDKFDNSVPSWWSGARNEGALGRSGQTLTAPCCDRVVGTASVYPVSRHQNRSRPVSITERGLVAEEPPTQCVSTRVSTRVPCVHILGHTRVQGIQLFLTLIIIIIFIAIGA